MKKYEFTFNLKKKYLYIFTLISISILSILLVNAINPGVAPENGHTFDQVSPPGCFDGAILKWSDIHGTNYGWREIGSGNWTCGHDFTGDVVESFWIGGYSKILDVYNTNDWEYKSSFTLPGCTEKAGFVGGVSDNYPCKGFNLCTLESAYEYPCVKGPDEQTWAFKGHEVRDDLFNIQMSQTCGADNYLSISQSSLGGICLNW